MQEVSLVEWGTWVHQASDRVFKMAKGHIRRRWTQRLIRVAKATIGPIPRPTYAEFQEWLAEAIVLLETPDDKGITPCWRAFSECGMGPAPEPNHDLQELLDSKISKEDMWWLASEAAEQDKKKQKRIEKKAERLSQTQSPTGSQSPKADQKIDDLFKRLAAKGREDDENDELVLDAEAAVAMGVVDGMDTG
jgi:hypothetical protein